MLFRSELYMFLSAIVLCVCLPVVTLLLKEKPETGTLANKGKDTNLTVEEKPGHTLPQALKAMSFWTMIFGFFCLGFASVGVVSHFVPILTIRGVSTDGLALLLTVGGVSLVFGRMLCGFLLDYFHAPYVAAVFIAALTLGAALLANGAQSYALLLIITVLFNLAAGAEFDLMAYFVSRYFGLKIYGMLYGLLFSGFYLGAGSGTWLVGSLFDQSGNYGSALWLCTGLLIATTLSILSIGRYNYFAQESKQKVKQTEASYSK